MPRGIYTRTPEMKTGKYKRTKWHKNQIKNKFKKGHKFIKGGERGWFRKNCKPWNKNKKCPQLSGENHHNWQGGKGTMGGYIYIWHPNHPFCQKRGYVKRSRLIMEKYLGRYLKPSEIVHHVNKIKTDDRIENFIVFKNLGYHSAFHRWNYYNSKYVVFDGRKL